METLRHCDSIFITVRICSAAQGCTIKSSEPASIRVALYGIKLSIAPSLAEVLHTSCLDIWRYTAVVPGKILERFLLFFTRYLVRICWGSRFGSRLVFASLRGHGGNSGWGLVRIAARISTVPSKRSSLTICMVGRFSRAFMLRRAWRRRMISQV